ncbi:MAG: RHS repeat-associated core domain-containing protein [Kiritimatiellae bacterium]|nr:RHS repeat-associated core domain-containing protein [Kiritimatiellia bacterium]
MRDVVGNVVSEDGATYPVRYTYDSQNRRTSLSTTRDGVTWDTTTWTYDSATGNCLSKTYADNSTVTYTYTPDNLPLRTTYASGRWKENVYDGRRQVVGTLSSGGENDATMQRDAYGRIVSESNNAASAIYALANVGTATNETVNAGTISIAITRTLDVHDRLNGLAIPSIGYLLGYAYADDGRIATISNADAVVTYAYTPDRRDAGYAIAFSGGGTFVRSVTHDPYRREIVTGIANAIGGISLGLAYGYDALARPVTRNGDAFVYNTRGEVESAMIDGNAETHGYDFIGNSLLATFNSVTNTYTANNLNQYVSILRASASPREISHDADGNMTNDGVFTYTYDSASRLTSVSSNDILLVTNQYDCRGRRVRKITQTATHTFFYDGWNLIYEHVANTDGTVDTFQYFWGRDLSGTLQGAGGVGGLLYVKQNGTIFVPHADAMGNILRYTDTAGNVVASYTYDAFGKTISETGSLAHLFRHRFSTKYYDAETGLYYYGYRFYSPSLKRWLNRDPIEEEGGVNLYGFCVNNAVCRYDKYGQAHFEVRRLSGLPAILNYSCFAQIIGVVPAMILDLGLADKLNIEILHEHLFYDDGDNIGYRDNTLFSEDSKKGYKRRDKVEYDDCIMHEAENLVSPPPYSLVGFGAPKYNCQDYADALRRKYNEIKDDPKIKCKCRRKK